MLGRQNERTDTAANWSSSNPVLLNGEVGYDTTNKIFKIGDGSTAWNSIAIVWYSNSAVGTITNKTLTDPKINAIKDVTFGNTILDFPAVGANYIEVGSAASIVSLTAKGADTSNHFQISPKGNSGKVTLTDGGDLTKRGRFDFAALTTGTARTYTWPDANMTVVGHDTVQTLTFKRITKRIGGATSSATPTANADTQDQYNLTAQTTGMTFGAPTGTPTDGQMLMYRVKTAAIQTIAFNAIFRAIGVTAPTATVAGKTLYIGTTYNAADTKWDILAVGQEA